MKGNQLQKFLISLILVFIIKCREKCLVKNNADGMNKEGTNVILLNLAKYDEEKKRVPVSKIDKSNYFYKDPSNNNLVILSYNSVDQYQYDAFETFWLRDKNLMTQERRNTLNEVIPKYYGCWRSTNIFTKNSSYQYFYEYVYPVTSSVQVKYQQKRIESINTEKFASMNILFEGIFRLIDKINEIEVGDNFHNDVPIVKTMTDYEVGIKNYDPQTKSFHQDDIIFRDPGVLLKYDKKVLQDFLKRFKDFGNESNVTITDKGVINLIQLYEYWKTSTENYFNNSIKIDECFKIRENTDPLYLPKCPSIVQHVLNSLNDDEYKMIRFITTGNFPRDYENLKGAIWKVIKYSVDVLIAVRNQFRYDVPKFNRELKMNTIIANPDNQDIDPSALLSLNQSIKLNIVI